MEHSDEGVQAGRAGRGAAGLRASRGVRFALSARPFLVLLELTRACALACAHCRAEAMGEPEPGELSTAEVRAVLEDLGALGSPRPHVVFTGGDPLRRADLDELVGVASRQHLAIGVSPAGTALASRARLEHLRRAGAGVVSFSLDGSDPPAHDGFRCVPGSFAWTLTGCRAARAAGLRLQVNTTVCAETVGELPGIARLVHSLDAGLWSVFFLVPLGRGRGLRCLSAADTEDVLAFLADVSTVVPLKTTEAPAYRRVLHERLSGQARPTGELYERLWQGLEESWPEGAARAVAARRDRDAPRRAPLVVSDGRGVVFVSRTGTVQPSGFLPLPAGNVRDAPLTEIYRTSELLQRLRDRDALRGRCWRCDYAEICGGSRALAFAEGGDAFGEDPSCGHQPGAALPA